MGERWFGRYEECFALPDGRMILRIWDCGGLMSEEILEDWDLENGEAA